jgi:sialic acid synthase SpsE
MQNKIFISEVSSNHSRNLERCYAFINKSAEIGCGAVKFQLFKIKELFSPEILRQSAEHRSREAWELPVEFLPKLSERCKQANIQFCCTPFYLDAVAELLPYVDFYKIASYELMWDALLEKCAKTGKPMVVSTGMATMAENSHPRSSWMISWLFHDLQKMQDVHWEWCYQR